MREAAARDEPAILAFMRGLHETEQDGEPATDRALLRLLDRSEIFIAEDASGPVGMLAVEILDPPEDLGRRPYACLMALAVSPARRGAGVGSRLVERMRAFLRRAGIARVDLYVRASNAQALAFYRKQGFCVETLAMRAQV
ncbi:GNAT family N-acetyltransferase [Methylocella sp.]|uniref:GNAT family N-acetyltransferase n=1 Tax=Methylocella sp. TaxID=1978226 RepID=UPI00378450EA